VATFAYLCITNRHNGEQPQARVAQLVERDLAKVEVASSNLVSRSRLKTPPSGGVFCFTPMATPRKCLSTDEEFRQVVAESLSVRQVLERIGLVPAGGNYKTVHTRISKLNIDASHFTGKGWNAGPRYQMLGKPFSWEGILVENSAYTSTFRLRKRLIEFGFKEAKCESCGLVEWLGKSIPLELHHVNGVNNDHRLANLQLLCPNCHALTENYRGKNQRKAGVVE
jgi:hypothetical protein